MDKKNLQQIEQVINYEFSNKQLLTIAFTHSSSVDDRLLSNERLEFLGDSILGAVICKIVYHRFPRYLEGSLTKLKSSLVSRRVCAKVAKRLELVEFLKCGRGMEASNALLGSMAAGLLEAVVGAIYIDGGFEAAEKFISDSFKPIIGRMDANSHQGNYKSLLQQYAQQHLGTTPIYQLLDEKGPDHNKSFEVEVIVARKRFGSAWGRNKKETEQKAAYNALIGLGIIEERNTGRSTS